MALPGRANAETDRFAHTARRLPVWLAELRSNARRQRSLRWRTKRALRELGKPSLLGTNVKSLPSLVWRGLGNPWAVFAAPVSVAVLVYLEVGRAPLDVFFSARRTRELLGLLWQVEAVAIAFVLAAALFVFESMARQRATVPLDEYARKSSLAQFLMLTVSGLLSVPVVLFSTSGGPDATASFFAGVIAMAGLVSLPFFFLRCMRVAHPDWFRSQRLEEVRRDTSLHLERQVFERVGLQQLTIWAEQFGAQILSRMLLSSENTTELSSNAADVLDIDLETLEAAVPSPSSSWKLVVATRLGEGVWPGASMIGWTGDAGSRHRRPAVTVTLSESHDKMDTVVRDLHEEAVESIRRGSPAAASEVAVIYGEVWLAWPRKWAQYGFTVSSGLVGGLEPFRIHPADKLNWNLATAIRHATDEGLQDHVREFTSVLWAVGMEAVRLEAFGLVDHMMRLSRSLLVVESQAHPDIATYLTERAWRYQIEVCEYAGRSLDSTEGDLERLSAITRGVRPCFKSIIESLRLVLDAGKYQTFHQLDGRFRKILQYWDPSRIDGLAQHILDDPDRFDADEATISRARKTVALESVKEDLEAYRRAGRLSILGWILRRGSGTLPQQILEAVRELAASIGPVDETVVAAGVAMDVSDDFLSTWLMFEQPELEAGWIDSEGPVLLALGLVLLSLSDVRHIPPADWMTDTRINRARQLLDELVAWDDLWSRLGESPENVRERAGRIGDLFDLARKAQREYERVELIQKNLDPIKVEEFQRAVVEGWSQHRVLPEIELLTDLEVARIPDPDWKQPRFGFNPQLDPKGLFVSPSNWVGLEGNGTNRGRQLALEEVSEIIRAIVRDSQEVLAQGEPAERVVASFAALRSDGFDPSLVVLPINWQLARSMDLEHRDRDWNFGDEFGRRVRGSLDGVPVIDWWEVPDDRILVVDLSEFCQVREAVDAQGEPRPPDVTIDEIDEHLADEIIARWEPLEDPTAADAKRQQVLSSVRVRIHRPFQLEVLNGGAARFVTVTEPEE